MALHFCRGKTSAHYLIAQCIVYSGSYPKVLEIDSEILVKRGNVRIGDIMNMLPPGIEVNPALSPDTVLLEMGALDEEVTNDRYIVNVTNIEKLQQGE